MTPVDRSALVERLARARAWNALPEHDQTVYRQRASADVIEIETSKVQGDRIGWMLIDVDSVPDEAEA